MPEDCLGIFVEFHNRTIVTGSETNSFDHLVSVERWQHRERNHLDLPNTLTRSLHANAKSFHSTLGSFSIDMVASFQKELALKVKDFGAANDRKTRGRHTVPYGLNYRLILLSAQIEQWVSHRDGPSELKACAALD